MINLLASLALLAQPPAAPEAGASVVVTQADESKFPEIALEFEVRRPDGSFLLDAPLESFRVTEYDEDRPILTFEPPIARNARATTLVLVVDRSGSMLQDDRLGTVKRAVASFLEGLPAGSRVAVIAFGSEVELICPFTADLAEARAAVDALRPAGATRFYDAVAAGLELIGDEPGRRAILALTDGEDTASALATLATDVDLGRRLGLPIHTVALGPEVETAAADLKQLAESTRGRFYPARASGDLSGIYEEIARRLRSSYGLTYRTARPLPDGTLRPVRVTFGTAANAPAGEAAIYIRGMVVPAAGWHRLFVALLAGLVALGWWNGRRRGVAGSTPGL